MFSCPSPFPPSYLHPILPFFFRRSCVFPLPRGIQCMSLLGLFLLCEWFLWDRGSGLRKEQKVKHQHNTVAVLAFCCGPATLPSPSFSSQARLQLAYLREALYTSFHPFSICLSGGSQQPPSQNLAASRVGHSFPRTCFEHPPYPRLPSRG